MKMVVNTALKAAVAVLVGESVRFVLREHVFERLKRLRKQNEEKY